MWVSRRAVINVGLLVLVNIMWAVQYPGYKTATEKMGPVTAGAWPLLLASVVLLPFLLRQRRGLRPEAVHPPRQNDDPLHDRSSRVRRSVIDFLMLGALGLIPGSTFLAWGTMRSTASNAALLYLTIPIITALLAVVMLGERMTSARRISLFISLVGVLILSDFDLRHMEILKGRYLLANGLILIACTGSSFYNVYCKALLSQFMSLEILIYSYLTAVVLCIPLLIWVEPLRLEDVMSYTFSTWLALLAMSVFTWGLGMVLWLFVLKRLDVSQASVSVYLLPFLGVLISALTLNERITGTMVLGGLVTLLGTVVVTSTESRPP